jgi:hypothetical protein
MLDQLLTRKLAMKDNMDPRGIKWGIGKVKGTALFHVDILEGSKNSSVPEDLMGKFTSATKAQKAIEKYLAEAWNANDIAVQKTERRAYKEKIEDQASV